VDFFDQKQGILLSFFWMLAMDRDGEVWAGCFEWIISLPAKGKSLR
jgi:hypothetical protein